MNVFQRLMLPANLVCDRIGLTNEHECGWMRMEVNVVLCAGLAGLAVFVGWKILA